MAHPKADALITAAISGNVAKIRELLAAGAPIEAQDANRMTPLMLAAQGGHVEAFHVLVEAGANLHAVAGRQMDVLEMAARGGRIELVKFLLDRGLPVNGHWQPPNEAYRKLGHETPLFHAAAGGHVEIARILLEAGADRNALHGGKTALEKLKSLLRDREFEDEWPRFREIAALLGGEMVKTERSADAELREVKKFADNGRQPGCARFRQQLVERCGAARPWQPVPDHGLPAKEVVAFRLKDCKKQKTLEELQEEARKAGCHLVLAEPWAPGEDADLVLFPTESKFAVVAAVGTEGANYGVKTSDIIAWLEELEEGNPFHLVFCNHELVGGAFLGPVKGAKKLAERMVEVCPSCLDEGFDEPGELALALKKSRSFLLRWD